MILLDIIRIIFGLLLSLFLPGYLIARIAFKELDELEKIGIGFILSICIDIFLGLLLGYNKQMKDLTGGITALNLWLYLSIISIMLLIAWIFFNTIEFTTTVNTLLRRKPKQDERYTLHYGTSKENRSILIRKAQPSDFKNHPAYQHVLKQKALLDAQAQRKKEFLNRQASNTPKNNEKKNVFPHKKNR